MTFRSPEVSPLLLSRTEQFRRELLEQIVSAEIDRVNSTINEFNQELRRIDEHLQLVRAREKCSPESTLKPGYWHVIRDNPGAPPSVMIIEGPNGEYVEPTSQVFERLREGDLWSAENMDRLKKLKDRAENAAYRKRMSERSDRQEELKDRWNAAQRTSVSMDRSAPWRQNQFGRRG